MTSDYAATQPPATPPPGPADPSPTPDPATAAPNATTDATTGTPGTPGNTATGAGSATVGDAVDPATATATATDSAGTADLIETGTTTASTGAGTAAGSATASTGAGAASAAGAGVGVGRAGLHAPLPADKAAIWSRFGKWEETFFPQVVGLELEEAKVDYARLRLPYRPELRQPAGVVHGGAIATLIDTVVVPAVGAHYPALPVMLTIDMQIRYLGAARETDLVAEGWVVKRGKSIVFCQATVVSAPGSELVAEGWLTYRVIPQPPQPPAPPATSAVSPAAEPSAPSGNGIG